MKGDFTRQTFRSRNHYRGVLQQQGRVLLDADWNEQVDIQLHRDRTTTRDTFGPHGAPADAPGMAITCDAERDGEAARDGEDGGRCPAGKLQVGAGRYYVDGILCENEAPVDLAAQPDLPGQPLPGTPGRYVAYLDVWSEHVTAVERPELREVALGGPDTTTRARTIWQVRLAPARPGDTCASFDPPWLPARYEGGARLRAGSAATETRTDPCTVPTTGRYRRLENQLYRVEIHSPGQAAPPDATSPGATFVWSRDNGSVVAALRAVGGDVLTLDTAPRDEEHGFRAGDWVEVTDQDRTRRGDGPGFLGKLGAVDGVTLKVVEWRGGTAPTAGDLGAAPVVRRWDSDGALPVTESEEEVATGWTELEDGVAVQFEPGGTYRTGDHWLIPARTASRPGDPADPDVAGAVEWPRDGTRTPLFQEPAGVEHHVAALATLDLDDAGGWAVLSDCRRVFTGFGVGPEIRYAGGDGQEVDPGRTLPQPLQVSVRRGLTAVPGAAVRFTLLDGGGRLVPVDGGTPRSETSVDATADEHGLARCSWTPAVDPARPSQRVTAQLVGPGETLEGPVITFSAQLALADRVGFDGSRCDAFGGVTSVQAAVDRLAALRSLVAVGGDGQDGPPGVSLPLPVEVLVRSDCGAVPDASVRFTVASGAVASTPAGLTADERTTPVRTDGEGVARCFWELGPTDLVQSLTAELVVDGSPVARPTALHFTANLERGRADAAGLHVTDVVLLPDGDRLPNDSLVPVPALAEGLAVVLDGVPLRETVRGKPVLTLTLDLPYPLSDADRSLWQVDGDVPVIGTTPLTLDGDVDLRELPGARQAVTWVPGRGYRLLLDRLFPVLAERTGRDRVLARLTLTGRALVAADDPRQHLNGLALGRSGDAGTTELALPTVDDVRAADFTSWFWLVPPGVDLVLLPTRAGALRLKAVRDTVALATSPTRLRATLPAGVRVTKAAEPDLDAARQAAARDFNTEAGRRLELVADARYADAANALREMLAEIDVDVVLDVSADPVGAVRARTEGGEPLDAVLTDSGSTGPVSEVGGFARPIPL